MKYDQKNLKINSMALIALAVCDAVYSVGQILATKAYDIDYLAETTGSSRNIVLVAMVLVYGITVLCFAAYIFMGVKGISQSNGKGKGRANVIIANIFVVINIILLLCNVIHLVQDTMSANIIIHSVLQSLLPLCFLISYVKCAKAVS